MMRKQLILASASPRRKELMQDSGLPFQIIPSKKEEIVPLHLPAAQAIEQLALQKASDIFTQHPDAVVIGCDTMVIWEEERLGKPKDQADALRMLKMQMCIRDRCWLHNRSLHHSHWHIREILLHRLRQPLCLP